MPCRCARRRNSWRDSPTTDAWRKLVGVPYPRRDHRWDEDDFTSSLVMLQKLTDIQNAILKRTILVKVDINCMKALRWPHNHSPALWLLVNSLLSALLVIKWLTMGAVALIRRSLTLAICFSDKLLADRLGGSNLTRTNPKT